MEEGVIVELAGQKRASAGRLEDVNGAAAAAVTFRDNRDKK
jgi:hypothetical protein